MTNPSPYPREEGGEGGGRRGRREVVARQEIRTDCARLRRVVGSGEWWPAGRAGSHEVEGRERRRHPPPPPHLLQSQLTEGVKSITTTFITETIALDFCCLNESIILWPQPLPPVWSSIGYWRQFLAYHPDKIIILDNDNGVQKSQQTAKDSLGLTSSNINILF